MTSIKITVTALALLGLTACGSDGSMGAYGSNNGILQSSLDQAGVEYFNQEIGDTVLFLVDQSSLTSEATDLLNKQAEWLLNNTDKSITIEGHADETGTREYNLALGARRAASVKNYLVSRGLTASRINTVTFGKERPLSICSDEACWSKNRRSVTLVAGGLGY